MAATSIPENFLVKEVLHCCSGINGRQIYYQGIGDNGSFACAPGSEIPLSQQQLIRKLTELGWLLRKIKELSDQINGLQSVVHEALTSAVQRETSEYYRLIAILEAQAQPRQGGPPEAGPLTLRRLKVWLAEPIQRLRTLAICLESVMPLRAAPALNALHAFSKHGDPIVRKAIGPLLNEAFSPFLKRISAWVLDGALEDGVAPGDFLISRQPLTNAHPGALWQAGFALDPQGQVSFIREELAKKILTAGRSINYLRECCGDLEWTATLAPFSAFEVEGAHQIQSLESSVDQIAEAVGGRLLDIVMKKEELPRHLDAMRRYVLLGQGDFLVGLLDAAGAELEKPARELSSYALQGHLDAALRSSGGAAADGDSILGRIDVSLARGLEGDSGWDVFSLKYRVNGPISAVLNQNAMATYGRISRLLLAAQRTSHVLAHAWGRLCTAQRAIATLGVMVKTHGIEVSGLESVPAVLRFAHARRSEMAQIATNFENYAVFEVIEPAWARFQAGLPCAKDLDAVCTLHDEFLSSITWRLFLDGTESSGGDVHGGLRATLRAALDVAGPIRRLSDALVGALTEQQLYLEAAARSEVEGSWSDAVYNSPTGISLDMLKEVKSGIWRVHSAFDRHLRTFLAMLPARSDLDLRFFLARFDFEFQSHNM